MSNIPYAILLIVAAGLNLYYCVRFVTDSQFAENYVKTSHRAAILRKVFGKEQALRITRRIFAPLGIIVGVGLIVAAVVLMQTSL